MAGVERPLQSWLDWGLARFSGYVDYAAAFDWAPIQNDRHIVLNLGTVKHVAEVWLNDRKVGERMWPPFEFDVTQAVRTGSNRLRVRVGNLSTNEMAQFEDRRLLSLWGWGAAPGRDGFDGGLFGPVTLRGME